MSLGSRIREYRIKRGFTQSQMAEKLNMTEANFSSYERNKSVPPSEKLNQIASILNVSADYLLGRTDDPRGNTTEPLDLNNLDDDYRKIERFARKVSGKDRKKVIAILEAAFEDAFKDDDDEEDI